VQVTQQTEVTIRVPRHEANMIAEAIYEMLGAMSPDSCCRCTQGFPDGGHNWRSDPRLVRELYNQLRPEGWQPLLPVGPGI
jgi:hypothetical protein